MLQINKAEYQKGDMLIYNGKTFEPINKDFFLNKIKDLEKQLNSVVRNMEILNAKLDYDHGIITEEEYNNICGSKM